MIHLGVELDCPNARTPKGGVLYVLGTTDNAEALRYLCYGVTVTHPHL